MAAAAAAIVLQAAAQSSAQALPTANLSITHKLPVTTREPREPRTEKHDAAGEPTATKGCATTQGVVASQVCQADFCNRDQCHTLLTGSSTRRPI